jgi:hypothetical protein
MSCKAVDEDASWVIPSPKFARWQMKLAGWVARGSAAGQTGCRRGSLQSNRSRSRLRRPPTFSSIHPSIASCIHTATFIQCSFLHCTSWGMVVMSWRLLKNRLHQGAFYWKHTMILANSDPFKVCWKKCHWLHKWNYILQGSSEHHESEVQFLLKKRCHSHVQLKIKSNLTFLWVLLNPLHHESRWGLSDVEECNNDTNLWSH